jgi:hypothetical protein
VLDASVPSILSAGASLLGSTSDLELVLVGSSATEVWKDPMLVGLSGHPRVHLLGRDKIRDLLGVDAVSTFAATDRPSRFFEAMACGVRAVFVGSGRARCAELDPDWIPAVAPNAGAVLRAMSGLLGDSSKAFGPAMSRPALLDPARRVEHAVAWMLGLERDPVPAGPISEDPAKAC